MPTYPDELMIGSQAGGVAGMVRVSTLGAPAIAEGAFTVDPVHRSVIVVLGDGSEEENGWLQCGWHINGLRGPQYEALITYKTAHSNYVYIRTLDNDSATYKNYLALAIWPVKPNRSDPMASESGAVFDFEIRFIQMVEQ